MSSDPNPYIHEHIYIYIYIRIFIVLLLSQGIEELRTSAVHIRGGQIDPGAAGQGGYKRFGVGPILFLQKTRQDGAL